MYGGHTRVLCRPFKNLAHDVLSSYHTTRDCAALEATSGATVRPLDQASRENWCVWCGNVTRGCRLEKTGWYAVSSEKISERVSDFDLNFSVKGFLSRAEVSRKIKSQEGNVTCYVVSYKYIQANAVPKQATIGVFLRQA